MKDQHNPDDIQPNENEQPLHPEEEPIQEPLVTESELEEEEEDEAGDSNDEAAKKKRKRGARGGNNAAHAQKIKEMEEEISKLNSELSEMKDKYLRLYADFDNYRKRTGKEKLDIIKTASQDVIKAILPAIDDFERAIKAADVEGSTEVVPQGIRLIHGKIAHNLQQQGLKEMESTGQPFNPDMHEALTKIPAPTPELKGKIVDTLEKGYYLGDKIIRYAKVVVGE